MSNLTHTHTHTHTAYPLCNDLNIIYVITTLLINHTCTILVDQLLLHTV